MNKEDFYWFWLLNIPRIGNKKIEKMLEQFHSAAEIFKASERELMSVPILKASDREEIVKSRRNQNLWYEYDKLEKSEIHFIHRESSEYPLRLKHVLDSPYGLFYKGILPDDGAPSVGIVGARDCTHYGKEIAKNFAREFAEMGIQVISGMARGIDTFGHLGCMQGGGKTFAVMGCGVDICYPRENINLYMDIQKEGGIISELPPGTKPLSFQFPMRNRIISAFSDVLILIEARQKSGSLITVDQALEQNKEIMVVPGRIGDKLSEGCNNLIKMGASVITDAEDIFENTSIRCNFLNNLKENHKDSKNQSNKNNILLAPREKMVYSCVDLFPKSLNRILEETGLGINEALEALLNLQLRQYIREISQNYYVRAAIKV